LLVFVWLQSAPLLVRPVFIWADRLPAAAAISAVQEYGAWVVASAVLAAIARAGIQLSLAAKVGQQDRLTGLEERFRTSEPLVPALSRLPLVIRLIFRAAILTLVLAGLFSAVWQALLTFVVLLAAQFLSTALSLIPPSGFV
jgi:hypothetical protein